MSSRCNHLLAGALLASLAAPALAGRPLATDDAATADVGRCQLESWSAKREDDRNFVLSGACGAAAGLEIGLEAARARPRNDTELEAGVALKWAPAAATFGTPLGELRLGAKAALGSLHPRSADWELASVGALGLASLATSSTTALHLNLGALHDRDSGRTGALLNVAATWSPASAALLFAEVQATDRRSVGPATVRTAGARWWIVPDTFGLDLTVSRAAGSDTTQWSLGFGWYGIDF
jgi:hypothetical protein